MNGRFCIQRVEYRLDENNIRAAVNQPACGLNISLAQIIIGYIARARVIHIGRNRGRAIGRPQGTGDITRSVGGFGFHCIAGFAGNARTFQIKLIRQVLHVVIGLRDRGRGKCIGADNVAAGLQISGVNIADNIGLAQCQEIIIAFYIDMKIGKARPAIILFRQIMALDHRAHRPVKDHDAAADNLTQQLVSAFTIPTHTTSLSCWSPPKPKMRQTAKVKSAWFSV